MKSYFIEPRTRKHIKGYGFLPFARNLSHKYRKSFLDTTNKTRLDALKTASNKLVHKSAEATDKFIENTIADKTVTTKSVPKANSRNVKEIVIPPEQRKKMINELRQVS